jgi:hypothetical protein
MEMLAMLVIGILGGGVVAAGLYWLRRKVNTPTVAAAFHHEPPLTDMINMASIKVAGVGGGGMIGVSILIALTVPAIGAVVVVGLVMGALMALVLIRRRRRIGVMPSSSRGPGAKTVLAIDSVDALGSEDRPATGASRALSAAPA